MKENTKTHNFLVSLFVALALVFSLGFVATLTPSESAYAKTNPKKITKVSTDKTKYKYTGKKINVRVKVYAGKKTISSKNYKVTFYKANKTKWTKIKKSSIKTAGIYKVTVTGKKGYKGTKSKTFSVYKKSTNKHIHDWTNEHKEWRNLLDQDDYNANSYNYELWFTGGTSDVSFASLIEGMTKYHAVKLSDNFLVHNPNYKPVWKKQHSGYICSCGQKFEFLDWESRNTHTQTTGHTMSDYTKWYETVKPAVTNHVYIDIYWKCSCGEIKDIWVD